VTIRLRVDDPGTVVPGQHIDVRLTADDGYQAVRSYSLSATPVGGPDGLPLAADEVEVTVEELPEGEVSPYLVEGLAVGERLEVRGPVGGWFVWRDTDTGPVQLIGGGSGVAPLAAILRARVASGSDAPMRLLYSVRSPDAAYFSDELERFGERPGVRVDTVYTRRTRAASSRPAGRITAGDVDDLVQDPGSGTVFVCGPNSFVAAVPALLLARGHAAESIRTERFGGI
jgi:ferredoxin-NADP reductase